MTTEPIRPVRRLWMSVWPIAILIADVALTLHGQPADYWAGSYWQVREHNPLAHWLLATHPGVFLVGSLVWGGCVVLGIMMLPFHAARVVALVVLLGHGLGTTTWLLRFPLGPVWAVMLLLFVRVLVEQIVWPKS